MRRNIYLIVLLTICFFCTLNLLNANSQIQLGKSTIKSIFPNIDSKRLLREWISIDTSRHKIKFIDSILGLELKSAGSNPYYFSKDSLGQVSSSGYFPNWPPLDCDLLFISEDTLKVTYSQMGDRGESFLYVKKQHQKENK